MFTVLSMALWLGVGTAPPDIQEWTAKAQKGDAEAQFELGMRLHRGDGVAKDDATALSWFLKAAAADHSRAAVQLGSFYAHGFGTKSDWAESIRWYRQAARAGDRIAQHNLGLDYAHGHGVGRDEREAARWFRLAAEQGQPRAQFNLGELYERGEGVPQSNLLAFVLFALAAKQPNQDHIFGEAKARKVVARRDKLKASLGEKDFEDAKRRIAAFEALVAVHPRRFGAPGGGVGQSRGWYIWQTYDPDTQQAKVANEKSGEIYQVRVLHWATTYRRLNYGVRPDDLLPGERVNLFFDPDENHRRGFLVHFQDEICQMKGHGHFWQVESVSANGRVFTATAMAGDKPLEDKARSFVLDAACRRWQGGQAVDRVALQKGQKLYLTWALSDGRQVVHLLSDDASLEAVKKEQADQLAKQIAAEGVAGQVESVDGERAHVLVYPTYWSQVGRWKDGQAVRLSLSGKRDRPQGDTVAGKIVFRKNRGTYGSGVTDAVVQLQRPEDAQRVRSWPFGAVIRVIAD